MKKIIIFLTLLNSLYALGTSQINFNYDDVKKMEPYSKGTKERKELLKSPYKTDLIIGYLNSDMKETNILKLLYIMTNNDTVRVKIKEELGRTEVYDKNMKSQVFKLLDKKDIDTILKIFNQSALHKIKDKNFKFKIMAIMASIIKKEDKYLYSIYIEKGLKAASNKYSFYYMLYKSFFKVEDYINAYEYLKYINDNNHYKYIEEDLLNVTYLGSKKYFDDENYLMAWYMGIEGVKYIDKVNYNRNIDKSLALKDIVFKSSQKILNSKNKIKGKSLYIIQTTKKYLVGDKK